jgi:hypothetical protein
VEVATGYLPSHLCCVAVNVALHGDVGVELPHSKLFANRDLSDLLGCLPGSVPTQTGGMDEATASIVQNA